MLILAKVDGKNEMRAVPIPILVARSLIFSLTYSYPFHKIDKSKEIYIMSDKDYDNYFGGCPECGGTHGYLNVNRNHWFVCDDHKTAWFIGSNIFSLLA